MTATAPAPVPNVAPTASFTKTVSNLSVAVDSAGSSDPDGTIASYGWTWGDTTAGTGKTASHTYPTAGSYQVSLTVTDDRGAKTTTTQTVTATAPTLTPTFNVMSYGALGDDTADDTTEIQAAITAAAAVGGTVAVPAGTYRISAALTVPANTTITGNGVIHQGTAGKSGFRITGNDVTIDGLTLTGQTSSPTYVSGEYAIFAQGASATAPLHRINIRNVTMSKWGDYGVWLRWAVGFNITGCNVFDIGYTGIGVLSASQGLIADNRVDNISPGASANMYGIIMSYAGGGGLSDPASSDIVVTRNAVSRVAWEGIDSHGGSRLTIEGNTVQACDVGITVFESGGFVPKDIAVTGNLIDGSPRYSVQLWGKTNGTDQLTGSVANNTIRRSGIVYLKATKGLIVSGNSFEQINAFGVYLSNDNAAFSITGNTFTDMWSDSSYTAAILASSDAVNNTGLIEGNTLRAGTKTARYVNQYGLYYNRGLNGITLGTNYFAAATVAPVAGVG